MLISMQAIINCLAAKAAKDTAQILTVQQGDLSTIFPHPQIQTRSLLML